MRPTQFLAALSLLAACEKGTQVTAAPDARVVGDKLVDSDAGVTLQVDPSRYMGVAGDAGKLVQLHLEIDNLSGRPLALSEEDFRLVAPDGRAWVSVDPARVDLSSIGLRDDLLDKGVSELLFETGNDIDGYIYFQGLPADVREVELRVRLHDGASGERFGELVVPLIVFPEGDSSIRTSTTFTPTSPM